MRFPLVFKTCLPSIQLVIHPIMRSIKLVYFAHSKNRFILLLSKTCMLTYIHKPVLTFGYNIHFCRLIFHMTNCSPTSYLRSCLLSLNIFPSSLSRKEIRGAPPLRILNMNSTSLPRPSVCFLFFAFSSRLRLIPFSTNSILSTSTSTLIVY